MEIEKECAICGQIFQTETKIRKYCDDCLKHKKLNLRIVLEAKERLNTYREAPEVYSYICKRCGKEFKNTWSNLLEWEGYKFCTWTCMKDFKKNYNKESSSCMWCGRSLADSDTYNGTLPSTWYCSKECREEYRKSVAREQGRLQVCKQCGKEFVKGNNKLFCSMECVKKAYADGWRPAKKPPEAVMKKSECPVCHKRWIAKLVMPQDELLLSTVSCCSDKCKEIYEVRERLKLLRRLNDDGKCPICKKKLMIKELEKERKKRLLTAEELCCSKDCRTRLLKSKRKRFLLERQKEVTCPICRKKWEITLKLPEGERILRPDEKCCSDECRTEYECRVKKSRTKVNRLELKCPVCGKAVTAKSNGPIGKDVIYCSEKCEWIYTERKRLEKLKAEKNAAEIQAP